jgi:hypothetical protein
MTTANSRNFDDYVAAEMRLDKEAIERLKRRYPEWEFVLRNGGQRTLPNIIPEVQPAGWSGVEPLIHAVERLIRTSPNREWISSDLYAALVAENYPLPEPKTQRMANISTALGKLSERPSSSVRLTYKGSGRNPNRYQWRDIP